jgi:hypothetical protein
VANGTNRRVPNGHRDKESQRHQGLCHRSPLQARFGTHIDGGSSLESPSPSSSGSCACAQRSALRLPRLNLQPLLLDIGPKCASERLGSRPDVSQTNGHRFSVRQTRPRMSAPSQSQQHLSLQQAQVPLRQQSADLQSHLQFLALMVLPPLTQFSRQVLANAWQRTFYSTNNFSLDHAFLRSRLPPA